MASYSSTTPVTFDKIIPEADTEVYGKLLAQGDQQYQLGVQKVNSAIQSAYNIPTSSEDERQYVQKKGDELVSNIRRMVGVDYTDQKISGTLAQNAASIYRDPNVQKIVYNASQWKHAFDNAEEDLDQSKGASQGNMQVIRDQLATWRQSKTVGQTLPDTILGMSAHYTPYTNKEAKLSEYWKNVHPDQYVTWDAEGPHVFQKSIGAMTADDKAALGGDKLKWEAVRNTWEEVKHDKAAALISDFVTTNPDVAAQMKVDTYNHYRGDDGSKTYADYRKNALNEYEHNKNLVQTYANQLVGMQPGSPEYTRIATQVQGLQYQVDKYNYLTMNGRDESALQANFFKDIEASGGIQNLRNNLFNKMWIDNQADGKSYHKQEATPYGMSPDEQNFKQMELQNQVISRQDQERENTFKNAQEKSLNAMKIKLMQARIDHLTGANAGQPFEADAGIATSQGLGAQDKMVQDMTNTQNMLDQNKNDYMFTQYDEKTARGLFNQVDGKWVPKDANAQAMIDAKYKEGLARYNNGDKTLTARDLAYYGGIAETEVQQNLAKNRLVKNDQLWNDYVKANPGIQKIYSSLDDLNKRPLQYTPSSIPMLSYTKGPVTITGTDLENYARFIKSDQTTLDKAYSNGAAQSSVEEAAILAPYHLTTDQYHYLQNKAGLGGSGPLADLVTGINNMPHNKSDFQNKLMQESNIYTAQTMRTLSTGNAVQDKSLLDKLSTVEAATGLTNKGVFDAKAFKENNMVVAGTQGLDGSYSAVIYDPTGKRTVATIPLNDREAAELKMKDIIPNDPGIKRLALNSNGLYSNTGDGTPGSLTYMNAFKTNLKSAKGDMDAQGKPLPEGTNLAYHYEHDKNGFYLLVVGKDPTSGKEFRVYETQPSTYGKMAENRDKFLKVAPQKNYAPDHIIDNYANTIIEEQE